LVCSLKERLTKPLFEKGPKFLPRSWETSYTS
jgi:hypothetical protein